MGNGENRYHDVIGGDTPAASMSISMVIFCG